MEIKQADLGALNEVEFHPEFELTLLTTAKLSAKRDVIEIKNKNSLPHVLKFLNSHNHDYVVLGAGSNFIPSGTSLILWLNWIADATPLNGLRDNYVLDANISLGRLTSFAIKMNLRGWELFTGVPANLGGAIYMNAGTRLGEIGSLIKSVKVIDQNGLEKIYEQDSIKYTYRKNHFIQKGEVVVEVEITHLGTDEKVAGEIKSYIEYRRKTQPLNYKNCGCVFKNPTPNLPAGLAIDLLGLKGQEYNGIKISEVHANFFENINNANNVDYLALIELVRDLCERNYHLTFEMEVKSL